MSACISNGSASWLSASRLTHTAKSQFIIATHSPILLTFPGARILSFDGASIHEVSLGDTTHYQITRGILSHPEHYWRHLRTAPAPSTPWQRGKDSRRRGPRVR
jgi:hypothetical protein